VSGVRIDTIELSAENAKKLSIYEFLGAFTRYFHRYGVLEPKAKIIHYHAQLEKLVNTLGTCATYKSLFEIKPELLDLLQIREEKQVENVVDLAAAKAIAEKLRDVIYEHLKQNPPTFLGGELKSIDQEALEQDYKRFYPYFLCSLAALEAIAIRQDAKKRASLTEDYFKELLGACLPYIKLSDPDSPRRIAETKPANMLENQQNFKNLIGLLTNDEELQKYYRTVGYVPVEQLKMKSGCMDRCAAYMYKKVIAIIAQSGTLNVSEQEYYFHLFCRMALNETQQKQKLDSAPKSPKLGPVPPVASPSSKKLGPTIMQVTPGALISGSMWTRLNGLGSGIRKATGVMANLASQVGIPTP